MRQDYFIYVTAIIHLEHVYVKKHSANKLVFHKINTTVFVCKQTIRRNVACRYAKTNVIFYSENI